MKYVVRLDEVPLYDAPPGEPPRSVAVMMDTGKTEELTIGLFVLPAGKRSMIDYHDQDESYFITRGKGQELLWLREENGEPEKFEIDAGSVVFIPRTVRHQMVNTGEEDIWLVWFFPRHSMGGDDPKHHFSPSTWVRRQMPRDEWYPLRTR
jgi:oxalate decarboxylase/phosphoglucose isomerase-like protein (cupin superfamily)